VTGVQDQLLQGFYLDDLLVEPLTGSVCGPGVSGHLPSKAVEVLQCLANNAGALVSRDILLREVWGEGSGSQEALSHAVSEIRHTLGDHHDHPHFIQTVPTRGYRLLIKPRIASADEVAAAAAENASETDGAAFLKSLLQRGVLQTGAAFLVVGWVLIQVVDATGRTIGLPDWANPFITYVVIAGLPIALLLAWFFEFAEGRFYLDRGKESPTVRMGLERNYLGVFAAFGVAALGAAVYQVTAGFEVPGIGVDFSAELDAAPIPIEPNSIAVLPLLNIGGSEESRIFSEGLAEDVLDRLAKIPGLLVSSRGDSWSLPKNASSEQVRQRLRVAYFVAGSIRLADDNLRVVVQMIDSATGFHRVSRIFEKHLEDYAEIQKEITNLIVANLRVALPETELTLTPDFESADVDAYVLYRRGKDLLHRPQTLATLEESAGYFEQSLELDPGYAAAHAGLCQTYAVSYAISDESRFIADAETACSAALAANPNLYMVYSALGELYLEMGRDNEAEAAFLNALDTNAQDAQAMQGLALAYEKQQRFDEAEELLGRAILLQPGNWRTINTLGGFLFAGGRFREASAAYKQVVILDPENWQGHGNLGSALLMAGEFEAAGEALQRSVEIHPDGLYYSNLGIIYYYLGQFDESVAIHRKAVELPPNSSFDWINLGDALLYSSEPEKAPAAFQESVIIAKSDLAVNPRNVESLYGMAWASAMLGDPEKANELINRAKSIDPTNPYVHYFDALVKTAGGDFDEALQALQSAVDRGYPAIMLENEPHLADLKGSEQFSMIISASTPD
jgi:tetratricopeptide (TPR) repeat protein/DNA-binding winged helix-turn-helix (wHTH) protein